MNVLITGANGQLAKEIQRTLKNYDHTVTALDKEALDISDINSVKEAFSKCNPGIVMNCAAYNLVDKSEEDFDAAFKVNASGVKNLALVSRENNAFLIHYSTDYVFDGTKEDYYKEEDNPNPISKYGESKLSGERFLAEESDNFLLFRLSWVFGQGKQNFLYRLTEWAKKNRVLRIVCDQISVPTYTKDIASLTMFAISKGLRGVYHLTNSGYASKYEVARYFMERFGLDNLILPVRSDYFPSPARRPYFSAMSNNKLSKDLNVDIPYWKLGIDRYVEIMLEREEI
ncbi:MAG: dTDP-4-dehydrorhamnose reductase [Nitrospirae bacterium RBG_13_39_12]|nr:MAG: dTDP-4-dehydrorhamnose reductase [Nitrospirae bacterium RBG_13_39_12]